ncbi:hypothetical protein [Secundilactobacillus muriivasis]
MTNFRKHSMAMALGTVTLSLALGGLFSAPQNASAKTKWTKNTPTALRGTWRAKKLLNGTSLITGFKEHYQQFSYIDKTGIGSMVVPIDNPDTLIKPYYHHTKGTKNYYVKGSYPSDNKWVTVYDKFQLSGKKLRYRTYLVLDKKGHKTKLPFGTMKSYSQWMYKGQAQK